MLELAFESDAEAEAKGSFSSLPVPSMSVYGCSMALIMSAGLIPLTANSCCDDMQRLSTLPVLPLTWTVACQS